MGARKPHHPPIPGAWTPPTGDEPGYFHGSLGLAGFGCRDSFVAAIPVAMAREIIRLHHYSRSVVANSYVHLGIWVAGEMLGVMQFGYALNPMATGKVVAATGVDGYLELNRMWLDDRAPRNSESRALAFAIRYIRRACPRVEWIQSFADERCGRFGVVYQAANFLFVGEHRTAFYELDGETFHKMLLTAHGKDGRRGPYLRANINRAVGRSYRQFRYVFFIRKAARRRLRMQPRPYPKPAPLTDL